MIARGTIQIVTFVTLLSSLILSGCFLETRLTKAANNNRANHLKDKPCPDCPSMGVIQIFHKGYGDVKIMELCDKALGKEANILPSVSSQIAKMTKARISKLEYHKCVSAGYCSDDYVLTAIDKVNDPSAYPVIVRLQGAKQYKAFLSKKLALNCRFLRHGERNALRQFRHSPTPPCGGCIGNDYNEVYALNEISADIGSYPTSSQCGMLNLQAVSYDLEMRDSITNTNLKMHYNLRLICS